MYEAIERLKDGAFSSTEYSEAELFVSKEKEHELMRQRMRMLKERRRKNDPNSVLLLEKTAKEERGAWSSFDRSSKTACSPSVDGNRGEWSPANERKSTRFDGILLLLFSTFLQTKDSLHSLIVLERSCIGFREFLTCSGKSSICPKYFHALKMNCGKKIRGKKQCNYNEILSQ